MNNLVGIREAAKMLGVSPSTISRQVSAGIIPNHGVPGAPCVSIEEAREARKKNTDPTQRRERNISRDVDGSFHAQRTERERIGTELKKLELAEKLGAVVQKTDAENALFTFGRRLRDELINRWPMLAQDLQNKSSEEIARIGVERDEKLLALIATEIEKDYGFSAAAPA